MLCTSPGRWLSQEGKLPLQGWSEYPRGMEESPLTLAHRENRRWHLLKTRLNGFENGRG